MPVVTEVEKGLKGMKLRNGGGCLSMKDLSCYSKSDIPFSEGTSHFKQHQQSPPLRKLDVSHEFSNSFGDEGARNMTKPSV
jgi:hypothetical protein